MHWYVDTCVLVSLLFRDDGSESASTWLTDAVDDTLTVTPWSKVEFASAAGILARRGSISAELHHEGLRRFEELASSRLAVESVTAADYDLATRWLTHYASGLRAGDALHLAVCARLRTTLCTADQVLAKNADRLEVAHQVLG